MYTPRRKETLMMLMRRDLRKIINRAHLTKENDYLETATKLLKIISIFAIIFGGLTAFIYLNSIQHRNVFAEALRAPYSFVAILIVFSILFLLIFIGFIAPYIILLKKSNTPSENWKRFLANESFNKIFFTLLFPHAIYIYSLTELLIAPNTFKAIGIENYFEYLPWLMAISPAIPLITLYFFTYKSKNNYFVVFFYIFIASSLGSIFPVYTALHILQWISKELNQLLLLFFYEFIILLNLLFASSYLSSTNNQKNKGLITSVTITLICYLLLTISLIFVENFPFRLLHPIRFVESPDDASWYLIHRNSSEINSEDLKKIKSDFICLSSGQQNEKTKPKQICTEEANHRHNALFGYMAWNLGNVKVFCPITVKNDVKTNETGNATNKCLTIDGKALQKMHGEHISYDKTP